MSAALFFDDEQVEILREILDHVPLTPRYIGFVADVLQRLPESAASPDGCSGGAAQSPSLHEEAGRCLSTAIDRDAPRRTATDRIGTDLSSALRSVFETRLPHGGSSL